MDSQWLKMQFKLNPGRSKAGLARALSLEPPAVSKILSGNRQIKAHEYIVMREFFGLPVERGGAGTSANSYVMSSLGPQSELHDKSQPDGEWVMPASVMERHTTAPPDQIRIFEVRETTMQPDYKKGEHVIVDLSDKSPSPPGVYVVTDGFGYMIRHCMFVAKSDPPLIRISALQNDFQPQILEEGAFSLVGRVIAKLQWV